MRWISLLLAMLLAGSGGCGGGEIDRRDELGMDQVSDEDPYELVIVDGPRDTQGEGGAIQDTSGLPVRYDPKGEFTVQVGVYRRASAAGRVVRELSSEGYPAYAIAQPDNKGVRVRVGYFASKAAAQRFGNRFKQDRGMDFWIDRRSRESF